MGKGFFKWFDWSNFLDTHQEWHAMVEGFSESFCFWRAHHEPSPELLKELQAEHHYYAVGRVVGFILLVVFGLLVIRILRGKRKNREYKRP